jgi:hypothetical protein
MGGSGGRLQRRLGHDLGLSGLDLATVEWQRMGRSLS